MASRHPDAADIRPGRRFDLDPLALCDLGTENLGGTFDYLGVDLQPRQLLHIGHCEAAFGGCEPARGSGRQRGFFHAERPVPWADPGVAGVTTSPFQSDFAQRRCEGFRAPPRGPLLHMRTQVQRGRNDLC